MLVALINNVCVPLLFFFFFTITKNPPQVVYSLINKVFSISVRMRAGRINSCSFPCLLVLMCGQQTRLPSLTLWPSHTHRPAVWKRYSVAIPIISPHLYLNLPHTHGCTASLSGFFFSSFPSHTHTHAQILAHLHPAMDRADCGGGHRQFGVSLFSPQGQSVQAAQAISPCTACCLHGCRVRPVVNPLAPALWFPRLCAWCKFNCFG